MKNSLLLLLLLFTGCASSSPPRVIFKDPSISSWLVLLSSLNPCNAKSVKADEIENFKEDLSIELLK